MPSYYKGSIFHGAFGHALMEIAPSWYTYFFPPDNSGLPTPYVLLPPLDNKSRYLKGHRVSCELTLVGKSAFHFALCQAAFEYLARNMGIGKNRGKFLLEDISVASTSFQTDLQTYIANQGVTPQEIITFRNSLSKCKCITISFVTRLRLKTKNRLWGKVPDFSLLFSRLVARLNRLAKAYGEGEIVTKKEWEELIEQAKKITIKDANMKWDDWSRFSGRQKSWMKFGGLRGSVTYSGDFSPFIPFLALGEWLHVGGKTSFGLGKYVMEGGEGHNVK